MQSRTWSFWVRLVVLFSAPAIKKCGSDLHVASTNTFLPDAWSSREGSIILSVGKETFEALGLPGAKFSSYMPGAPEQYRASDILQLTISYPIPPPAVIEVSVSAPNSTNVRSHDFVLGSLAQWDRSREESGEGQWDFAFHISRPGLLLSPHALL